MRLSKEIEIEFKSMLTHTEYEALLRYYHVAEDQFVTQTNTYFDTVDFRLKQEGMGLRIRSFASAAEATLKVPQSVGLLEITDSLTITDAEEAISTKQFSAKATEVLTRLHTLSIQSSDLHMIGKLITKRSEFMIPEGKLALDESWYSGHHDFELELEVPDSTYGEAEFSQLLTRLGLTYRKTKNKIERAVNAQLENNKGMEELK